MAICSITPASSLRTSTPKRIRIRTYGLAMIVAGGSPKLARGSHTRVTGTVGDVYVTVADEIVGAGIGKFPTATKKLNALLT